MFQELLAEETPGNFRNSGGLKTDPTQLFLGYDTIESTTRSTAVGGQTAPGGAVAQAQYTICTSVETLSTALEISASVSASFGFGSVDAKSSFMQKLNVTTTSVSVVVYASRATRNLSSTVAFSETPPADPDAFFSAYGDSWVSEVCVGGEYIAVYTFYSQSKDEQTKVTAELNASGVGASGSFDAKTQFALESACSSIETRQSLKQYMSGYASLPFPSSDNIITFAENFGSPPPDSPVVISFDTTGYEHVADVPSGFAPIVATRALFTGAGSQPGLADQYARLQAVRDAVTQVEAVYDFYGYTGDTTLGTNAAAVLADVNTLTDLFNEMETKPSVTYTAPPLPSLTLGTPTLSVVVNSSRLGGADGGDPFADVVPWAVELLIGISAVALRGGAWIDALITNYGSESIQHGQGGGDLSSTLVMGEGERIISIWGTAGDYVNQINFKTNLGNTLTWPPGPDGADPMNSWAASDATALLGFTGRAGEYLDQLGVVVATFSPATWS